MNHKHIRPNEKAKAQNMAIKKQPLGRAVFESVASLRLFGHDRALGADAGAGAAVYAGLGIDLVDVTGRNRAHRAFVDAGTASNAIFSNLVSHGSNVSVLTKRFVPAKIRCFFVNTQKFHR